MRTRPDYRHGSGCAGDLVSVSAAVAAKESFAATAALAVWQLSVHGLSAVAKILHRSAAEACLQATDLKRLVFVGAC
jgi:hypothetical protein